MMQNAAKKTNVIKAEKKFEKGRNKSSVLKNQVLKAELEAKEIIKQAEKYAENLRLSVEQESKEKFAEAFQKGNEAALLELQQYLIESKEIRKRVLRETEKDILRLSIRLAEKIVGKELETNSKTINDIVKIALHNARQKEQITIRVNPSDLQTVQKHSNQFKSSAQAKFIDFVADPRVEKGGCLIESEVGTVDARLATQFRVLERALLAQADGDFVTSD